MNQVVTVLDVPFALKSTLETLRKLRSALCATQHNGANFSKEKRDMLLMDVNPLFAQLSRELRLKIGASLSAHTKASAHFDLGLAAEKAAKSGKMDALLPKEHRPFDVCVSSLITYVIPGTMLGL